MLPVPPNETHIMADAHINTDDEVNDFAQNDVEVAVPMD